MSVEDQTLVLTRLKDSKTIKPISLNFMKIGIFKPAIGFMIESRPALIGESLPILCWAIYHC